MKLKKGDLILIVLVAAIAVGWYLKDTIWPEVAKKTAVIKVNDQIYTKIPLDNTAHKAIPVKLAGNNYVHVVIENDKVWVDDASCPDKVCVRTGKINKSGQSIVCLPNKTVVYIEGAEKTDIDDVSF